MNSGSRFYGSIILASVTLMISIPQLTKGQTTHILFDATKAEMAGNADWVIDADQTNIKYGSGAYLSSSGNQSNPQQIPTPAQSGISGSTAETYWTGALSSWAVDCVNKGYAVETLPWNGQITYNNSGNSQDLSKYDIFIIDEPNIAFPSAEKDAIVQYVQNGGSLFMIADHTGSDRNGDGWDAPAIWNDLFNNNTIKTNPFGIQFDLADFSQTTSNISASGTDSIIHGGMGDVSQVKWSGGTTMTMDPSKNSTVKGVVYKTGSATGNTNVMVAYARFGKGKVAAIGDSSPTDDGTGNPTCTLYNGYWNDASGNHRRLIMNITMWLATHSPGTEVADAGRKMKAVSIYPNPSTSELHIQTQQTLHNVTISASTMDGRNMTLATLPQLTENEAYMLSLPTGNYFIKVIADEYNQTLRATINQ